MNRRGVWWRIAWRNLGRHRGRSLISGSGLAFGYFAAVLMVGLADGMAAELIENGTRLLTGQAQIHAPDYLPERNMHHTIGGAGGTDLDAFLARVEAHPEVVAAAPRLYGGGLVSAGERTEAALLLGIDPEREARVTTVLDHLVAGAPPAPGGRELLLGAIMAERLGVGPGDEVVLVAPATDGSMGNDLFVVAGVFETGTPALDRTYAVLPLPDLQELLAMAPGRIHEVAVALTRPWEARTAASGLQHHLDRTPPPVRVRSWMELRPELAESIALMDSVNFVIVLVIFGMAVFGVANTMLISTFERRREFAVVRALGTGPWEVARTVIYEGLILGALALSAGALLTWPVLRWWHRAPPDLSRWFQGFEWTGAQWRPVLRVEPSPDAQIMSAAALLLTAVVAAAYPAWRAARLPPADTLAGR